MSTTIFFPPTAAVYAEDVSAEIADLRERLDKLERLQREQHKASEEKATALAGEIEKNKISTLIPERAELKSDWGLGPAASSIYKVKQGLSLAGYGEGTFRSFVDDNEGKKDETDYLRLVGYAGYKFNDWILFNSEVEFEHGTTGGIGGQDGDDEGEVSVEFAYLDFLFNPAFNARVGMVLIPMGFINEIHEPPFFHGVRRPEVEQVIIPTTWRENGAGIFGTADAAGKLEYRSYLVNGLRASRFSESGIRDGRQKGNRALFEDIAWTSRVDFSPEDAPGLLVGSSFWFGNSGQDEDFSGETVNARTFIWDAHAQYHVGDLELRALGAWGDIDDADVLSTAAGETIAEKFYGWYVEAAYNILPLFSETGQYLAPFFRYEVYDTQDDVPSGFERNDSLDKRLYTAGISYKPIPNVVLKLDYRNFETDGEKPTADEVAFGVGFAF